MDKKYGIVSIFVFLIIILILNTCTINDNPGTSDITIILDNSENNNMKAAPAVSDIVSFSLTVTGSGMSTITETYPAGTSSINLEVPSGYNRTFTLTAEMDPDSPSAVLTWEGVLETDLPGGETVVISIPMAVARTKLLIPDNLNQSIVMINDMSGYGWKRRDETDLNLTSFVTPYGSWAAGQFDPVDIEIGNNGDIYIANAGTEQHAAVIKISDINDTTPEYVMFNNTYVPKAIAIDHNNNYLYCVTTSTTNPLYVKDLNDSGVDGTLVTNTNYEISNEIVYGITVMENGNVILSLDGYNTYMELFQFNITGLPDSPYANAAGSYSPSYYMTEYSSASDVLIKNNYIYICYSYFSVYPYITQVTRLPLTSTINTLTEADEITFGYFADPADGFEELNGPARFINGVYEGLCFIDERAPAGNPDRLVLIDSINATDWSVFGSNGNLDNQFEFYSLGW